MTFENCIFSPQQSGPKRAYWWCCLKPKSSISEISHLNVVSQGSDFQKCDLKLQTLWKMKPKPENKTWNKKKPHEGFYWQAAPDIKWLRRDMWPLIISPPAVLTECDPDCSRSLCQRLLNISVSDISLLQTPTRPIHPKPTGDVVSTTESLYNRADLSGSFREKSVHSWKVQGQPDSARPALRGHPLFALARHRGPGTGLRLSVATGCRAAGISWLNFPVILFAVVWRYTDEGMGSLVRGKSTERYTSQRHSGGKMQKKKKNTQPPIANVGRKLPFCFNFYFGSWASAKSERKLKNS